jgi:putative DNA primase/helicase
MELEDFLGRLGNVRAYHGGWNACCPAHDDRHASLSVSNGKDGGIVLHCHAGCTAQEVVSAMELSFADLSPVPQIVASYPYTDAGGTLLWTVQRWRPKDFRVVPRLPLPSQRVLYAGNWIAWARAHGQPVLVVEGEKDADAAHERGLAATTCVGGAGKWLRHYSEELAGLHVTVVADDDEPGRKHAQAVGAALEGTAASIRLAKPRLGKDLSDHFAAGFDINELDPLGRGGTMPVYRGSDLVIKPVHWAWSGHIPLGAITVIDGDPGDGKSVLTCDLAARWSSHLRMPDGSLNPFGRPVNVIMVCAEDDLAATVAPRLRAHGADPSRVHLVSEGTEEGAPFSLGINLGDLEAAIVAEGARIVVLDPLMAYLPDGTDTSGDSSVRRALAPLMLMAHRRSVAVILVRHLNKNGSGKAIYRGGGSIAFTGLARSAFVVTRHPDDEGARVFAATKANLAPLPASLVYRLTSDEHYDVARVDWAGQVSAGAQELLDGSEHDSPPGEVAEWLMGLCAEPMSWREITELGKAAGYTEKSLRSTRPRVLEKIFGPGGARDVTWRAKYGVARAPFAGLAIVPVYPPDCPPADTTGIQAVTSTDTPSEGPSARFLGEAGCAVEPDPQPEEERDAKLDAATTECDQCGQPGVKFYRPYWVVRCRPHHPMLYRPDEQ